MLSHFECDGHTVHLLLQQSLPPPLTSKVKLPLFTRAHSSPLSLAANLHRCHKNHSCHINNGWTYSGQTLQKDRNKQVRVRKGKKKIEKAKQKEKEKRRNTTGKKEKGQEVEKGLTKESKIRFAVKWLLSKVCQSSGPLLLSDRGITSPVVFKKCFPYLNSLILFFKFPCLFLNKSSSLKTLLMCKRNDLF